MKDTFNGKKLVHKGGGAIVGDLYSVSFHDGRTGPQEQVHIWEQSALTVLLVYIIAEDRRLRGEIDDVDMEDLKRIMGP